LEALGRLRDAFSAGSCQITQVNVVEQKFNLMLLAIKDVDLISLDHYEATAFEDPIGGVIAAYPGRALSSDLHFAPEVLRLRLERGYVPPDHARFITVARIKDGLWTIFGLTRSQNAAPFTPEECARFGALSYDFDRIGKTLAMAKALQNSSQAAIATLSALDVPMALVQGNGDLVTLNPTAQHLLTSSALPWASSTQWVGATNDAARYGSASFDTAEGTVKLTRLSDDPMTGAGALRAYASMLVLADMSDFRDGAVKTLEQVAATYGLTPAEASILGLVGEGKSAAAIALARQSSKETIRTQLRSIRSKTGKSRLGELAALLRA
jgi:DNA-binding CsgD family transcriptional regulator